MIMFAINTNCFSKTSHGKKLQSEDLML